ncbi:SNF2 family N-terminal domain-containing protein [Dimargaris cristalligena]|uniref:SNF2 family N-terminal domain-containing protein n=1 Tax=Dimargaris cristalligena TaxID=215637 RepID=A0A4Q0A2U9_9FUNG|nr:SNF2 family N-terminal domain-containing protein [Dimargaris cristalligena]|eukprot:RKP40168.1 SNF2 family N-terminal domain-containing protein [Dimargaris cristalligena]
MLQEIPDPADPAVPTNSVEEPATTPDDAVQSTPVEDAKQKAMDDFDAHTKQQRFQRLNYLLQKSTVYANFLAQKLEQQQKEQREREQTTVAPDSATATAATPAETPSAEGSRRRGRKRKAGTETTSGTKPVKDSDYKITDYISASDIARSKAKPAAGAGAKDGEEVTPAGSAMNNAKASPSSRQPRLVTGGILREYQLAGLEWMVSLYENGLNGILADEMGLGKTLQTISFLAFLRERQVWGPFLIVCPLSTLANWVNEFQRFAPDVPVLMYYGLPEERSRLRRKHMAKLSPTFPAICTTYELVMNDRKYLCRYQWKYIIIDEGHRIKNLDCKLIRELKNYHSANRMLLTGTPLQNNLNELWSLLNFLLPEIFDDPDSFQSWFDFTDINESSGRTRIASEEAQQGIVSKLHHILRPFLLRRLKTDVEKDLPKKREYVLYAPLTHLQQVYYRVILEDNLRQFLQDKMQTNAVDINGEDGDDDVTVRASSVEKNDTAIADDNLEAETLPSTPKARGGNAEKDKSNKSPPARSEGSETPTEGEPALRRSSRRLRSDPGNMIISDDADDHEFLDSLEAHHERLEAQLAKSARSKLGASNTPFSGRLRELGAGGLQARMMQLRKLCNHPYLFDYPVDPATGDMAVNDHLIFSSGKLMLLDRLLPQLFARGHRVLVFSQFTRSLDILESYARDLRGWESCRIDGNVKQEDRRESISRFNTDKSIPLFFLSTRAGGLGINLTAADTVILFDSDWNPQMDLQAQDRVHRIGQTKPVIIYRLITANSIEKAILDRANSKRKLEKLVIHKHKFKGHDSLVTPLTTTSFSSPGATSVSKLGASELAEILAGDEHEKILTDTDLARLLDRSDEAYARQTEKDVGQVFAAVDSVPDTKNDMLAAPKSE